MVLRICGITGAYRVCMRYIAYRDVAGAYKIYRIQGCFGAYKVYWYEKQTAMLTVCCPSVICSSII